MVVLALHYRIKLKYTVTLSGNESPSILLQTPLHCPEWKLHNLIGGEREIEGEREGYRAIELYKERAIERESYIERELERQIARKTERDRELYREKPIKVERYQ